jgi:hypothetical protein
MPLSWNEIRDRAIAFSKEWERDESEDAEAKSFWDAFFNVFGVPRRRIATFETPVSKSDGKGGFIDLLWKGELLVEHKSRGKDLDRAFEQAKEYFPGLKDRDLPRRVLVSDFARLRLYDLEDDSIQEFPLSELHKNVRLFGFIAGYQTRSFDAEDPVNIRAAEQLGVLHDRLEESGYVGHSLEVFLVRILFCLFADDTSIFDRGTFRDYIEQRTSLDGSDLGLHLAQLFQVLSTPQALRLKTLDEQLGGFPYVNGKLFSEALPLTAFDRRMRDTLLDCVALDWSRISPALFGSLFQSIRDRKERRNLGAHYTSEANILKALRPLMLDDLRAELSRVSSNFKRLSAFHLKLANIRILDPACGCGNFLVIAYRELRLIELDVLRELHKKRESGIINIGLILKVNVDQFFGIEIEDWPAQIAQVALWLTDHQMNMKVSEVFGQYFVRLPLTKAPTIVHGDAIEVDWEAVVSPKQLTYIVGNPPFVGKKEQGDTQKAQLLRLFRDVKGAGVLDYVACWYRLAVDYMKENKAIRAAFVSTNSIAQGEQVGVLWPQLFAAGIQLQFAHRTFEWTSEAKGKAAVHCVIIGFGFGSVLSKWLFEYDTPRSEPHAHKVAQINAYLVPAANAFLERRGAPISDGVSAMEYGSMPIDDGWLVLSKAERDELLKTEPKTGPFIRSYVGGEEFINSIERFCLWLVDADPLAVRSLEEVSRRLEGNRVYRLSSGREATRKLAAVPGLFGEIRQPDTEFLLIPKVSSQNRSYLPIGFCDPSVIASGTTLILPKATLHEFGVLSSVMHNSWMRAVSGRMKSDYQYSAGIVYNNFPWPKSREKGQLSVEIAAQAVLDARAEFPKASLAVLYDRVSMPPSLARAHAALDRAVDAAYGRIKFVSEADRVAFLFERYEELAAPLLSGTSAKKQRRQNTRAH